MRWLVLIPFLAACTVPELYVEKRGDGEGRVVSNPAGIDCGKTCGTALPGHSWLTATPADGSVFVGWGGACSGTNECDVMVGDADVAVVATFDLIDEPLTIVPAGDGTVKSDPDGIDCGGQCAVTFKHGTHVRLTASSALENQIVWDAPECSGQVCELDLVEPRTIGVSFVPPQPLTVSTDGRGDIVSTPAGIDASHQSASLPGGTVVALHARAHRDAVFTAWGGDCAGVPGPDCTVVMDRAHSVSATFGAPPPPAPADTRPCTATLTGFESAAAFNLRLTENAVICLQAGVEINGQVVVSANNVTIRGIGGPGRPTLVSLGTDTVVMDGAYGLELDGLSILAPPSGTAIRAQRGSMRIIDSSVSCNSESCVAVDARGTTMTITGSDVFAAIEGQAATFNAMTPEQASITIQTSTVASNDHALQVSYGSTFYVQDSTLRGDGQAQTISFLGGNAALILQRSTIFAAGLQAIELILASDSHVTLDDDAFRKIAGGPQYQSAAISSGTTTDVIDALSPSTFCNEGTSTSDGAWVAPLLDGYYAPSSTFNSVANVGPIDCPN